ncbi:MAG: hypothetical protein A2046_08125 [Bacteroidetes bacterium GWA2_30_7]|nr:MAG: hypothetical protein A2046_08125 [Bacteroidetes bacterium GWA2_30_7]
MNKQIAYLFFLTFYSFFTFSQVVLEEKNQAKTLFGFQYSIAYPLNIVKNNDIIQQVDSVTLLEIKNKRSYLFGMEIRQYFTHIFSLQTGINFIRRNYDNTITNDSITTSRLQFIGYEIPCMALAYLRLTKNIYMDNAVGFSANFYPSDVAIPHFYGMRKRWVNFGLLANVGWEIRNENLGIFFIGFSYQYQFKHMFDILYFKSDVTGTGNSRNQIGGSYFSLNFKYFFPQNSKK